MSGPEHIAVTRVLLDVFDQNQKNPEATMGQLTDTFLRYLRHEGYRILPVGMERWHVPDRFYEDLSVDAQDEVCDWPELYALTTGAVETP